MSFFAWFMSLRTKNPADAPSRRLSYDDYTLSPRLWEVIEQTFGEAQGHTCDLMALDSNAMRDRSGVCLPHFTPYPSAESLGVNMFAQDLTCHRSVMQRHYVFPPEILVGPALRFLQSFSQSCTMVVVDACPRKFWWPLLQRCSTKARKLAHEGDEDALLWPSRDGWGSGRGIPGDLWAFKVQFN